MERVSEGSGVGVKGRIFIKVDKEQYAPGDLVTGTVFVTVAEPVQCKELVVIMNGRESVSWDESDTATTVPFEKELLHYKIPLCAANKHYELGDYEYQFTYHLPSALPATFNVENVYSGPLERLRIDVRYAATAWLTVEGASVSYLAATQPFVLYVPAAAMAPERPVLETLSENLRFLCCFNRGVCEVRATSAKNIHVAGDAFQLQFQVCNQQSACAINWVRVELVEELTLTDVGERTGMTVPRVISSQQFPGVIAGYSSELQSVDFRLGTAGASATAPLVPMNATTTSQHFRAAHSVRITCKPFGCRSLRLEVPLLVLHAVAAKDAFSLSLAGTGGGHSSVGSKSSSSGGSRGGAQQV